MNTLLHATIGNQGSTVSELITPATVDGGFDIIMQQVLLSFVADLQKGKLTKGSVLADCSQPRTVADVRRKHRGTVGHTAEVCWRTTIRPAIKMGCPHSSLLL
ncbi:MAG: hypothetical protein U5L01_06885 [Rheinheimera sp.]|nr:hypothetical protein [Rheinheimera sp.]